MSSSSCFCDKYFWFLAIFFALFFDNVFVVITDCDSGVSPVYKAKDLESVGLGAVNDFEAYLEVEDLVWTDERAALFLLSDLAWLCANILIFGLLIAFLPAIFAECKEKIWNKLFLEEKGVKKDYGKQLCLVELNNLKSIVLKVVLYIIKAFGISSQNINEMLELSYGSIESWNHYHYKDYF